MLIRSGCSYLCARCFSDTFILKRKPNESYLYKQYVCKDCGSIDELIQDPLEIRKIKMDKIIERIG